MAGGIVIEKIKRVLQKNKNNLFATQRKAFQTTLNSLTTFSETKTTTGTIDGIPAFYTNDIPIVSGTFKLLTVSYYDNYNFPNPPQIQNSLLEGQQLVYYNNSDHKPKGLPTASWVRVLQNQSDINGESSYTLYDNKSRPVKSNTTNYLGGYTDVESLIDFSGKTLLAITRHKRIANVDEIRTDEVFTYSDQDRLLTHTHQINEGEIQLLAANTYTEMGQLQSKNVGGTTVDGSSGLQKVDYTYNIRGWLTGINDTRDLQDSEATQPDLFAFKINYNTLDNSQTDVKKLYNGNIAETRWRTNFDNLTRSYGYSYDALNRLTNAQYVRPSNPNNPNPADVVNTFNEQLTYDKNGNIKTLVRNGGMESQTTVPVMDNLVYGYDANEKNKLIKVTDATANTDGFKDGANNREEYGYDPNGNMTRDDNKGISSMVYNHLNLPTRIVIQNGGDFPSISYLYTATGKKVAKTVNSASRNRINYTVDYLDGYQYESGQLLFFPTAEGYVKYTSGATNPFDYVFNYTDQLGNIRLSYGINPTTALLTKIEENNYYPFGLKHHSYNTEVKIIVKHQPINGLEIGSFGKLMVQKTDVLAAQMDLPPMEIPPGEFIPIIYSGYNYRFGGNEFQDELGLNVYDYDNRVYDQALGRFWQMDPLAEQGRRWSPYNYCFNNPIYFQDPDGMWPKIPSWSDVKKSYNEAKATVAKTYNQTKASITKTYNETKSSVTKTYNETKASVAKTYNETKKAVVETTNKVVASTKETLKEGQQWVKDNKTQLIGVAKGLQDVGDKTTTTGLVMAVAGAPVAGVGASPGLAVATAGGVVSTIGEVLEIGTNLIAGDVGEGAGGAAVYVAGELAGMAVDRAVPGPNPDVAPQVKELIQATHETVKNMASDKTKEAGNKIRQ